MYMYSYCSQLLQYGKYQFIEQGFIQDFRVGGGNKMRAGGIKCVRKHVTCIDDILEV